MSKLKEVWYVSGDDERILFNTKIAAEQWARILYPDEDAYTRYMRVFYREVFDEEYVKLHKA